MPEELGKPAETAGLTAPDGQPEPSRPGRRWLLWIGAGLLISGMSAAVVGLTTEVRPGRAEFPGLAIAGAAAGAVALIVVMVLSLRVRRDETDDVAFRLRRRWAAITALLAAATAAYTWWQTTIDLGGGMITRALPLFAAGFTLFAVGSALVAVTPFRPATPVRRATNAGATAIAALAGAALALTTAVLVERLPVDATTAAAESASPAAAKAPEQVIWQWDTPAGEQIRWDDIVPTPAGVAVRVADGVVALDGETGEETWRYRVSGARAWSIGASPSGEWVMATFGSGSGNGGVRVVAFDGLTGEIGFDELASGGAPFGGVTLDLTDDILIGGSPDDGRFTAFALEDGDRLWNWHVPDDCYLSGPLTLGYAASTTIALPLVCADDDQRSADEITGEVTFLGLDSRTGSEAWRVTDEFTEDEPLNEPDAHLYHRVFIDAEIRISGDGALAQLSWNARAQGNFSHFLVDAATGAELPAHEDVLGSVSFERSILSESPPGAVINSDGEYVLAPFDAPDNESIVDSRCDPYAEAWVTVGDALVELCRPVDFEEGTPFPVGVTPWNSPDLAYDFDVDLGPPADDPAISGAQLVKFPAVTVAISGVGTRLTALG